MTRPKFQWQISLGSVLQMGVIVVSATAAFITANAAIENNSQDITVIRGEIGDHAMRMRVLETESARNDERLNSILTLLARIDNRLERIENKENGQ